MKVCSVLSLLLGTAIAQDLPMAQYDVIEDQLIAAPVPYGPDDSIDSFNTTTSKRLLRRSSGRARRDDAVTCVDQSGNGPAVSPDTDAAFVNSQVFANTATTGAAHPPDRYSSVSGWVNLKGSAESTGYLTYIQRELTSYDENYCANTCTNLPGGKCVSFVIYYERDPKRVRPDTGTPDSQLCPAARNDPSVTLIKCAFYSVPLIASTATNVGQYQGDFHLVIAGSNAFTLEAPTLNSYNGPVALHNAALNIPTPVIDHGYIRVQTFPNTPFNPDTCRVNCESINAYNGRHNDPTRCTSFNAYVLYKNGANGVFTCVYYSTNYGASYATNVGQYNSAGDHFTIGNSYAYYLSSSPAPIEK